MRDKEERERRGEKAKRMGRGEASDEIAKVRLGEKLSNGL